MTKALIRLDSGGRFGLGHLMRSKALADELQTLNINCTFAVHTIHSDQAVSPHQLIFINSEIEFIILAKSYDIVIVDHYDYCSEQFHTLSEHKNSALVVLDDECNRGKLYADLIVNPVSETAAFTYEINPSQTRLLMGPEYALLNQSFQTMELPAFEHRKTIVITFGGSDVTGLTAPVLDEIQNSSLTHYDIIVITGGGVKNVQEIAETCQKKGFQHQHNVKQMWRLFLNAKIAISAAGTTAFELACSGTPSVFAVVADNQTLSINELCQNGWCAIVDCREENRADELVRLAEKLIENPSLGEMSQLSRKVIDGKGAQRVAFAIKQALKS